MLRVTQTLARAECNAILRTVEYNESSFGPHEYPHCHTWIYSCLTLRDQFFGTRTNQ